MNKSESNIVVFEFPNPDLLDKFLGWMSDGGGEQEFMGIEDLSLDFDYSKDGVVTVTEIEEEDE